MTCRVVLKWFVWEDKIEVFNQNTGNWNGKWYDDRSRVIGSKL